MKTTDTNKRHHGKLWIFPIILLTITVATEVLYRDIVYEWSWPIIISLQKSFNKILSANKVRAVLFQIVKILSTNITFFIISVLTYNFVNVYKSFVLVSSIFLSNYLSSVLCFIYRSPRPFMVTSEIVPFFIFNDWGNPNTQLATLLSFFLTLHKLIFKSKATKNKLRLKISLGVVFTVLTFLFYFLHLVAGVVSFNQIIMSIVIGVVTYLTLFTVCNTKMNNPKQFFALVNFSFLYYISLNLIMFAFLFILYNFIKNDEETNYYLSTIQSQVSAVENKIIPNDYRESFFWQRGNFTNVICFFMNIFAISAWKIELYVTYENNFEKWRKHNFEMKDKLSNGQIDVSWWTDYKFFSGTQWNHTAILITIVRFIVLGCLASVAYWPTFFAVTKVEYLFWDLFFQIFLPFTMLMFGMFYGFKIIVKWLKLTRRV